VTEDAPLDLVEEAESLEGTHRKLTGGFRWLWMLVAGSWSVFQLLLPQIILLDSLPDNNAWRRGGSEKKRLGPCPQG